MSHYLAAVSTQDSKGQLPVHIASPNSSDVEPVRCLLDAYPESVQVTDNGGEIPIHCASMGSSTLEELQLFV